MDDGLFGIILVMFLLGMIAGVLDYFTIQNNFNGNQMTYTHQTTNNYAIHISNNSSHMS